MVVRNAKTILKYGITAAPALVINGIVMFAGHSQTPEEIATEHHAFYIKMLTP